ncbi:MAG: SusC/RagA family TonB-linked outer membrane protein, partial [Chitinophagaceae bacterium]
TLNAAATITGGTSLSNLLLLGYFGRINYDFKKKYLLTINARYDGASNLGAANRWGFFPGVAVGWNIHEEKFWQSLPGATTLKLRGSYGINGNISGLGDYEAQGAYNVSTLPSQARYGNNIGLTLTGLPNPNLQWERSKTVNLGADLGLFNNRVTVIAEVYRRETENLLTSLNLPPSVGFGTIFTNLGSLENKGVELELGVQVLPATSAVSWNVSVNAAYVKTKVLELPSNGQPGNRIGGIQILDPQTKQLIWVPANLGRMEGHRLGDLYAYKVLGVYATDQEGAAGPKDMIANASGRTKRGGDYIFQDTDGNGVIEAKDKVYIGNMFPVWTGGFSTSVGYKNFLLTVRTDYALGHSIYNYASAYTYGGWGGQNAPLQEMLNRSWKKQGDITDMPRWDPQEHAGPSNFFRGNGDLGVVSSVIEKGDYLCIRELSLGYNLPSALLRKVNISNLRFNVTGNNLHYFTNYSGASPENPNYDSRASWYGDRGRFPIPRGVIFGVNVTF